MTPEEEKQISLREMKIPMTWPCWPYLPIKKRKGSGQMPDCGTLVCFSLEDKQPEPVIYDHFAHSGKPLDQTKVLARYDTLEALIADGWVVD